MLRTFSRDCSLLFVFARRRNRLASFASIFSSLSLHTLHRTELDNLIIVPPCMFQKNIMMSNPVFKFNRNGLECRSSTSSWHFASSNCHSCTWESRPWSLSHSSSLPERQYSKFAHVHVPIESKYLNETRGTIPYHWYIIFTFMIAGLPLPVYVFLSLSQHYIYTATFPIYSSTVPSPTLK